MKESCPRMFVFPFCFLSTVGLKRLILPYLPTMMFILASDPQQWSQPPWTEIHETEPSCIFLLSISQSLSQYQRLSCDQEQVSNDLSMCWDLQSHLQFFLGLNCIKCKDNFKRKKYDIWRLDFSYIDRRNKSIHCGVRNIEIIIF